MHDALSELRIRLEGGLELFEAYLDRWERAATALESADWQSESNVSLWRAVTMTEEERAVREKLAGREEAEPIVAALQKFQERAVQSAHTHLKRLLVEPSEGLASLELLAQQMPIRFDAMLLDDRPQAWVRFAYYVAFAGAVVGGIMLEAALGLSTMTRADWGSYWSSGGLGVRFWLPVIAVLLVLRFSKAHKAQVRVVITQRALIAGQRAIPLAEIDEAKITASPSRNRIEVILRGGQKSVSLPVTAALIQHLGDAGVSVRARAD